jgi:hypothetical protein
MTYSIETGRMRITIRNRGSDVLQLLSPRKVREANVFLPSCGLSKLFEPSATRKEIYERERPETRAQVAAAVGAHRKLGHNATADSVLAFPSII